MTPKRQTMTNKKILLVSVLLKHLIYTSESCGINSSKNKVKTPTLEKGTFD